MPPKVMFNEIFDAIIVDLFSNESYLTTQQIQTEFKRITNTNISYKKLKERYLCLLTNVNSLPEEPLKSDTLPCTSREADDITVNSLPTQKRVLKSGITITRVPSQKVIMASMHQGSAEFLPYAGNQCTALVIYATLKSIYISLANWNSQILDSILYEGTNFYGELIQKNHIEMSYLDFEEVKGSHSFNGINFIVDSYQINQSDLINVSAINKTISEINLFYSDPFEFNNFHEQLQIFNASNCCFALFICNNFSYGILKQNSKLYLYDSHAKLENGSISELGKASLRSFNSLEKFAQYMVKINRIGAYYQLIYFNIVVVNDVPVNTKLVKSFSTMSLEKPSSNESLSDLSFEYTELSTDIDSNEKSISIVPKKRKRSNKKQLTIRGEEESKNKKNIITKSNKQIKYLNQKTHESNIEKEKRLEKHRLNQINYMNNLNFEKNKNRLEQQAIYQSNLIQTESNYQKENRLEKQREYARNKRANETDQEKMQRLHLEKVKRADKRANPPNKNIASIELAPKNVATLNIGFFNRVCKHCKALYNDLETNSKNVYMKCCENGKIKLPIITNYHPTMKNLLVEDLVFRKHFLDNIRQYNTIMAFAGIKTNFDPQNFDNKYNNRRPYLYKCHGEMYFNVPPMYNDNEEQYPPQTTQFYIMDSTTAHEQRINAWRGDNGIINKRVLQSLETMIQEVNPFYAFFRNHIQEIQLQLQENPSECCFYLQRKVLNLNNNDSIGRQKILTDDIVGGEIAAVFKDINSGLPPPGIKVAIYPRKGHRQLMHICDPNVDPMCFPLLFPFGESGFQLNIGHAKLRNVRNRTTMKEFYKFRLHMRADNDNLLFFAGKLFQEYIVHSWIKVESNNLNALRRLQGQLRICDYKGLMDHKNTKYTPENINQGKGRAVVLNSNYPGSDRNMKQNYYDAMAIANKFGKGDWFITFTSNPHWIEIQRELLPGQTYLDRPDICSRVYEIKRNHFKQLMIKEHIMGHMEAWIDVKEYQKRGLPHDHTMWWLHEQDKIKTGEDIDKYVSAELPDPEFEPELYELVTKYMIHGPCTSDKPCMQKDGTKCSKGFPKPFSDTTQILHSGFPIYRRRNNGRSFKKNGHLFTNQHVVPYNRYLLMLFKCHINVEFIGSLRTIAYIMKYMCKGNDKVAAVLKPPVNVNAADIQVPIDCNNDVVLNEDPYIEDLIVDEVNEYDQVVEYDQEEEITIPLHDEQDLYVNRDQVQQLCENTNHEENDDYTDINNYIDEVQSNQPNVDINNNQTGNINNNFNRPANFIAYDEIKRYVVCRYVSAIEAQDKIMGFVRIELSHTIYRLTVHLPNQNNIIFNPNDIDTAKNRTHRKTMLLAWFQLNKEDINARKYLYTEIPDFYVYNAKSGKWTERLHGRVISRMHSIHPKNKELFNLRLLLLHVRGAQSFEQLKCVNSKQYDSFTAAALALNLITNSSYLNETIVELVNKEIAHNLRYLFAMICIHAIPIEPSAKDLWIIHKSSLSKDFLELHECDAEIAEELALQHIQFIANQCGQTMSQIGLPKPKPVLIDFRYKNPNIVPDLDIEYHLEQANLMYAKLNPEQKAAYDAIMISISNYQDVSKCYFIDGIGGAGKSFLIESLIHRLKANNKIVIPTAYTGIASSLITDGLTVHSRFKIPVPTEMDSISKVKLDEFEGQVLRDSSLVIIDEASMVSKAVLNCIDDVLKKSMNSSTSFGGKCIMLSGDFRQCLPVSDLPQIEDSTTLSLKYSNLWKEFNKMSLIKNMRANDNEDDFKNWSLQLGNGDLPTIGDSLIQLPENIICKQNIIYDVFGEEEIKVNDLKTMNNAILTPNNKDSLEINNLILRRVEGEELIYLSTTTVECDNALDQEHFPIENALSLTPNSFPPHELILKIGAIIILLRNWSVRDGLCNGTRMIVTQMNHNSIKAAILRGPNKDKEFLFNRVTFRPSENCKDSIKIVRIQLPFRLAFAMTINKSQGQTFDRVGLLLKEPVFSHGQLYVAISRVRSFNSIKVVVVDQLGGYKRQGQIEGYEGIYTKNIVDKSVL